MIGACNTHGRDEKCTVFWQEKLKERDYLLDPGVGGTIIFREIRWEVVAWMHLAEDRDQWWALENTEINILFP
jgi:hypothetical protein